MTTDAIAHDAGVVEYRREPACCAVAVVTSVAGRNMSWRLAHRLYAVVATVAATRQGRMIHECDKVPAIRRVTVSAKAVRRDMVG